MKAKILYFYELNKTKIILGGVIFTFLLCSLLIYNVISSLGDSEEVIMPPLEESVQITEEDNEEIVMEEEVKEQQREEKVEVKEEKIKFYVDIKGEIKTPGVYILEEGSRVSDVIKKAGGLTKNADTSVNNLSRKIKDEMVIIIYSKEEVENFAKTKEEEEIILEEAKDNEVQIPNNSIIEKEEIDTSIKEEITNSDNSDDKEEEKDSENSLGGEVEEAKKVSINTATKEELMKISGIGESKALAIIEYRKNNGNFEKLEDLLEVSGIGNALFEKIKDFIEL